MLRQISLLTAAAVISTLLLTPLSANAGEGGFVGGGGKGVVCDGKVQVLEIYEAELRGQKLLPAKPDLDGNLEAIGLGLTEMMRTNRYKFGPGQMVEYIHSQFAGRTVYIEPEKSLPVTNDATLPPMKAGCRVVQIALWSKDNWIYFDKNLWNQLDPLNQAVIMAHEIVYAIARNKGVTNSDESRELIRIVLTDPNPPGQVTPVLARPKFGACFGDGGTSSETTHFYVIDEEKDGESGLGFYFLTLKGQGRFLRTYGFLPGAKLSRFLEGKLPERNVSLAVEDLTGNLEWKLDFKSLGKKIAARASVYGQPKPSFTPLKCELRTDGEYLPGSKPQE